MAARYSENTLDLTIFIRSDPKDNSSWYLCSIPINSTNVQINAQGFNIIFWSKTTYNFTKYIAL